MNQPDHKGIASIRIGGKTYRLQYTFDDIADADQIWGRSVLQNLSEDPQNFALLRVLFFVGARGTTPHVRRMSEIKGLISFDNLAEVAEAVSTAIAASMPRKKDDEESEVEDEDDELGELEAPPLITKGC